jgi:Zn-dependent M16 (insulinase) family peptidase
VSHATRAYAQGSAEVEAVREAFLSRASLLGVAVNLQEKARAAVEPAVEAFLARLAGRFGANAPQGPPERQAMHRLTPLPPGAPLALRVLPSPVNYVAAVAPTGVSARHPDAPHLQLLARVISNNYLHREIREKGGAYGSSCSHGDGLWAFSTYRDPNTTGSLDVFRDSLQWAARGGFTEDHLNEAKLQVFAARDYPTHPGSKGLGRFYSPFVTHTDTQRSRAALLDATRADLLRAAEVHLGPKWFAANASISILGPKRDGAVQWEGRKGEAKEI